MLKIKIHILQTKLWFVYHMAKAPRPAMDKGKVADGAERESRRAAICFSSANVVNCSESCPSAL